MSADAVAVPICLGFSALGGLLSSCHLALLVLVASQRFGEARLPGPRPPEGLVYLGACNPTGLNSKHELAAQLPAPSLFAMSETHLTSSGVHKFRRGLKLSGSAHRFLAGAPAPLRPRSKVVGSHTGVGFMSSFPLRAAPHSWPDEVWNTSRAQISSVLLRSVWLLAAVVYGFASQPASTVALLEEVTQRVVLEADGPRLIAGDFNLEIDKIPCSGLWRERGFMEIQDLFQQLSGVAPRVTCKASTRKDFVFVSSELQDMLRNVVVDSTFFPDHAVLYGAFQFPGLPEPRTYWRVPVARPAKELQGLRLRQGRVPTTQDMDPTSAFQAICEEYENRKRQRLRLLSGVVGLHMSFR